MNIKQAKEQIKNAMTAYFSCDSAGDYMLPAHQQRPVFLMGPPGIGKTAIMEQVAGEMGVALLSYSMTHHTRQSALGLPFIVHKTYAGGIECDVSEYTMSEIIASVYDMMEETGQRRGILFLDEINCVSETLAPIMLQFLQYKVFGKHRVPEGWIVVTAGNPPEYNNSVREFDIVTWDRLKRIDVEPDFAVWKEYAINAGIHPAVITYLEIRGADFYRVQTTVDGKSFVTARGWEDLSRMIRLYELNSLKVDGLLVSQYLQDKKIAREFAQYYDLFNKYRSDYQVDAILAGTADAQITQRARKARFDERLSLISLMLDSVRASVQDVMDHTAMITRMMAMLKDYRTRLTAGKDPVTVYSAMLEKQREAYESGRKAASLSIEEKRIYRLLLAALQEDYERITGISDAKKAFAALKASFDRRVEALKQSAAETGRRLSNMFIFSEKAFGEGQELLIITTELTAGKACAEFIGRFGCEEYYRHNKDLLLYERQGEIRQALKELAL